MDDWADHTPAPRMIASTPRTDWPVDFQEVAYGPGGSWDGESGALHIACLMNPAQHRDGPPSRPFYRVAPSAAVARPGDGLLGGWSGRMQGRHLFIGLDRLGRILGEPPRPGDFSRRPFARDGERRQDDVVLARLLQIFADEVAAGCPSGPAFSEALAAAVVHHLRAPKPVVRSLSGGRPGDGRALARAAIDIIRSSLGSKLLLSDIAAELGVSVQHLSRAFKAETRLPPHRFIVRERVELARRLIEGGSHSLAETALAAGFTDQSQMTTTFRHVLGTTPGAIRRRSGRH